MNTQQDPKLRAIAGIIYDEKKSVSARLLAVAKYIGPVAPSLAADPPGSVTSSSTVERDALRQIADGVGMPPKLPHTHLDTVLAYQELARRALAVSFAERLIAERCEHGIRWEHRCGDCSKADLRRCDHFAQVDSMLNEIAYPTLDSAIAAAIEAKVLQKLGAQEPIGWQYRRKGKPWALELGFDRSVFASTNDSEVRPVYALPTPALLGASVGEPSEDGLTVKQAWWAGARAGLGVDPGMPRVEVANLLGEQRTAGAPT